ncbi:WD40-repeat-containing domain protein [Leucosporidium creatinivorum]|uniref:WD40-repeat-containing domain protein n=1 Tax=Leucosporidium creatinivorum TaxID=106004 RepID=A0A1Y2FWC3_9BASI|nr:WD40-repeat-containing domain protein [Leucosporidium creatinivorum]
MTPPTPAAAQSQPQNGDNPTIAAHKLVARFLLQAGYKDTLESFQRESAVEHPELNLQSDASLVSSQPDLRDVVEAWISSRIASLSIAPAPLEAELHDLELTAAIPEKVTTAIRDGTNVLSVKPGVFPKRTWDSTELRFKSESIPCFITASVDRTLKIYRSDDYQLLDTHALPSPVLSFAPHPRHPRFVCAATMEGTVAVVDLVTRERIHEMRDHLKYIVSAVWSPDGRWIATLGYDKQIIIYEVIEKAVDLSDAPALLDDEEPDELSTSPSISVIQRRIIKTRTNPEAAVFLPKSDYLVYSARDDNILHEIRMPGKAAGDADWALSGFNLNENNDDWISFSVLFITIHPHLPILALQTSTENSRILLYPFHSNLRLSTLHTSAAQSDFFTPRHSWLPDGTAILVNSEDGVLRLVDLRDSVRARIGAHGVAAPTEEEENGITAEVRTERARLRREQDRGSSVVKDVVAIERNGKVAFVSCGFDKTVKVIEIAQ